MLKCPRFPSTRLPSECSSVHKCPLIVRGPECFPSALNVRVPLEYLLCVPECLIRCHWNKMLHIKKMFYVCEKNKTKMVHWVLTKLILNQSAELKSFRDWLYKFDFCTVWILFFVGTIMRNSRLVSIWSWHYRWTKNSPLKCLLKNNHDVC